MTVSLLVDCYQRLPAPSLCFESASIGYVFPPYWYIVNQEPMRAEGSIQLRIVVVELCYRLSSTQNYVQIWARQRMFT